MTSSDGRAGRSGLRMAGAREMLLPVAVSVSFVLYQLVGLSGPVVAVAGAPFLALYMLAPRWARASLTSFDRDLVRLLASGRGDALGGRFARALGMRLFAPPALIAERHAVVAAEVGELRQAHDSYRRALAEYGPQAPLRVMLGYAHACYELCEDREAIRMYERLLKGTGELPRVRRNLAHSLLREGADLERALSLLDTNVSQSEDPQRRGELDLLRALAHAKLGEPERASLLTRDHQDLEGEFAESLRAEIDQTLAPSSARPIEPAGGR